MTTTTSPQDLPAQCKTLIFNPSTRSLRLTPLPPPTPDFSRADHLIRVHSTALCARELLWPTLFPAAIYADNPARTVVPGYDLAGTVQRAPPDSAFKVGDEIFARTTPSRPGNCREYTIARTEEMARKPQGMGWEEAAAVPLSAVTAWQVLFEQGGVQGLEDAAAKGKRVLVTAAAGGVGVWVVQLARIAGLHVIAQVGSVENEAFVKDLGAAETINYKQTSLAAWAEKGGRADIVLDCVGGTTLEECWGCVADGGVVISIVEDPKEKKLKGVEGDVRGLFFIMRPDGGQLAEIAKLWEQGRCKAVLDSVWELEEYEKAFEKVDGGHAKGKVVVRVAPAGPSKM